MCRLTGQRKIWPGASRMLIVRHMPWRFTFLSIRGGPSRASRRRSRQSRRTAPGHVTSRPAARTSTPRSLPPTWCPVTMRRRWPRAGRSFRTNWPRMPTRSMRATRYAADLVRRMVGQDSRGQTTAGDVLRQRNVWVDAGLHLHLPPERRPVVRRGGLGAVSATDHRFRHAVDALMRARARPHLERHAPTRTEIDTNSATTHPTNNAAVVQPWQPPGHLTRFRVPPDVTNATYSFSWRTNRIDFATYGGHVIPTSPAGGEIAA